MEDFDGPWKEALERFFPAFLAFFFPKCHDGIDWSRGYESLDTELQQVVREAEVGKRWADKLFRVYRKGGEETWVLIHVEVQSQPDSDFAERMYVYNYRLYDRFRKPVASLAVLADERSNWRPDAFGYEIWDCVVRFRFPTVKLLDFASDLLEKGDNVFGIIVLAHLKTMATRRNDETRKTWKLRLVKALFDRGWDSARIREVFRVIDWLMWLPKELAREFMNQLHHFEEERKMPYITSVERLAMEDGIEIGRKEGRKEGREEGWSLACEGIALALEMKYGDEGLSLRDEMKKSHDFELLKRMYDAMRRGAKLEEIRDLIQ